MLLALLRKNRFFFIPYAFILLIVGVLQLMYSQESLMQAVNVRNSISADLFFTYATYMGDGVFFVVFCLILLLINRQHGALAFASFALSSLTSIFLKQVAFPKSLRPLKFFEHSAFEYHIIKGLDIYSYNSFPSGHSTSAFALFCMLALLNPKKNWNWLLLLPALITGLLQSLSLPALCRRCLRWVARWNPVIHHRLPAHGSPSCFSASVPIAVGSNRNRSVNKPIGLLTERFSGGGTGLG